MTDTTTPAAGATQPAPETTTPSEPAPETKAQPTPETGTPQETKPGEPAAPEKAKEGESDEETKQRKRSFQQRIDELTQKRRAAEARAEAAETEVRRLSQLRPPGPDASPDEEDAWRLRKTVRQERIEQVAAERDTANREAGEAMVAAFQAKAEAVSDRIPGLFEKFCALPDVSPAMAEFVAESEKGAEVAHFLANNAAEASRIARLPPHRQGVELARVEGRLTAPQARRTTNAPAPVPTVAGSPSPAGKSPHDMNDEEYGRWYRERKKEA